MKIDSSADVIRHLAKRENKKLKEKFAKKNIPVEVIDSTAYGLCDAESILEQAKNMKKGE